MGPPDLPRTLPLNDFITLVWLLGQALGIASCQQGTPMSMLDLNTQSVIQMQTKREPSLNQSCECEPNITLKATDMA